MAEGGWAFCQGPSKQPEDCQGKYKHLFFFFFSCSADKAKTCPGCRATAKWRDQPSCPAAQGWLASVAPDPWLVGSPASSGYPARPVSGGLKGAPGSTGCFNHLSIDQEAQPVQGAEMEPSPPRLVEPAPRAACGHLPQGLHSVDPGAAEAAAML